MYDEIKQALGPSQKKNTAPLKFATGPSATDGALGRTLR